MTIDGTGFQKGSTMINDKVRMYLLPPLFNAAVRAGAAIMQVYKNRDDYDISLKDDKTPITLADRVAHRTIREYLGPTRIPILSEEGREITLYRLFEMDICLFSASCMLHSIQFDLTIEAEKDTSFWLIPAETYRQLMETSAPIANYTNEIMASRFSEVMWRMEQVMWKSLDQRLASFLLEEEALEGSGQLHLTHELIGNHLGSAREVVTRMLRYFQEEGMVRLSRGTVEILDREKLGALARR